MNSGSRSHGKDRILGLDLFQKWLATRALAPMVGCLDDRALKAGQRKRPIDNRCLSF